jgi:flavin reductase (DIM6/NTAB) family NADH-FMN oxidoreductase RutF
MELRPDMFKKLLPLPVTIITTIDVAGRTNAAPYGCVMPILRPLDLVTFASALPRHTLRNIRETGEFVVNIIGRPSFKEAMHTAKNYPPGVNELEAIGLESVTASKVKPLRMKDALGWIEAVLVEEILRERYSLVIGKVVCAEINDLYADGENLREPPAIMLNPGFRTVSEDLICDVEEITRLFLPPGSMK